MYWISGMMLGIGAHIPTPTTTMSKRRLPSLFPLCPMQNAPCTQYQGGNVEGVPGETRRNVEHPEERRRRGPSGRFRHARGGGKNTHRQVSMVGLYPFCSSSLLFLSILLSFPMLYIIRSSLIRCCLFFVLLYFTSFAVWEA